MFKLKDEKQKLSGVIADSFGLTNATWAPNIVVVLIALVLATVVLLIVGVSSFVPVMHSINWNQPNPNILNDAIASTTSHISPGRMVGFAIGAFVVVWILKIMNAILVRSSWNTATTANAKLSDAFAVGLKYFYVYLVVLIVLILLNVIMFVVQYAFSRFNLNWVNIIVAIITQIIVYYITVKLFLVEAAAVIEQNGMHSFGTSWRLVGRGWWRTVGSFVFSTLFYMLIIYLIGLGIFWMIFLPALPNIMGAGHTAPLWFGILSGIIVTLTGLVLIFTLPSMVASNQVVLYNDLKHRLKTKTGIQETPRIVNPS